MSNSRPIGVFDSGIGGLTVVRAMTRHLPHENITYFGDTARVPYGPKSSQVVRDYAAQDTDVLMRLNVKAIVIACNTATAIAIADLRAHFAVPIVGMEPAVKPASTHSRTRCIGVLATSGTLASDKFASLLARFGRDVEVHVQPCSGLVEQVERGALNSDATRALVEKYVTPLARRGVDTIVLGCTHYPFLRPVIAEFAGANVSIIDPNPAVARELRRQLERSHLRAPADHPGTEKFWTSAEPSSVQNVMIQLWGDPVAIMRLPTLTPDNRLNDAKLE